MTRLAWLYGADGEAVAEIQLPEPEPPAVVRWGGRTFVHTALNRDMRPFAAAAGLTVYVEAQSLDLPPSLGVAELGHGVFMRRIEGSE